MEGYVMEEFASSYYFYNHHNTNESTSTSPSSSAVTSSSFFRSTVVRSIFGGNHDPSKHKKVLRKIRSQAPSFRQNCASTPQSQLESSENKFLSILIDFAYLSNPDQFEGNNGSSLKQQDDETLDTNTTVSLGTSSAKSSAKTTKRGFADAAEQEHLEREFATKYQSTLKKFYNMFQDIYHYYMDIQSFVTDLDGGHFVEHTLRSLLLESVEAKQLLCELLYLYGSLLVLMDIYIPVSFFSVTKLVNLKVDHSIQSGAMLFYDFFLSPFRYQKQYSIGRD